MEDLEKGEGVSMEHSKESRAFRDEFEEAKQRQDEGLDEISEGSQRAQKPGRGDGRRDQAADTDHGRHG